VVRKISAADRSDDVEAELANEHTSYQRRKETIMPTKVSVGLSKKAGLPNYGSGGASCHVELERDSHILDGDPERFRLQVQKSVCSVSSLGRDGADSSAGHRRWDGWQAWTAREQWSPERRQIRSGLSPQAAHGHSGTALRYPRYCSSLSD